MVDPSKDQFYQQRLAPPPWGHHLEAATAAAASAAAYGAHPSHHQQQHHHHSFYDPARLQHSLAGLQPHNAFKEPPRQSYAGYPMHLAALTAAVAATTDFSRPHPAHGLPVSSSSNPPAPSNMPLPAHLPRHHQAYPNYHDPYAGYYDRVDTRHHHPPSSHNGYNPPPPPQPPPPSHAIGLKDSSHKTAPYESNGYKPPAAPPPVSGHRGSGDGSRYPFPYGQYPPYAPHLDVAKLGYQFGHHQPLPPLPTMPQNPLPLTSVQSSSHRPPPANPSSAAVTSQPAPTTSLLQSSLVSPVVDKHYRNGGVDMTTHRQPPQYNLPSAPPPPAASANPYLSQLVTASPLPVTQPQPNSRPPPAVLATANSFNALPPQHQPAKRKPERGDEPPAKKPRSNHDPYSFEDDNETAKKSETAVELARFGSSNASSPPVSSPSSASSALAGGSNGGSSSGGSAYKFKSALLSRGSNIVLEPPKLSSKTVPLAFDVQPQYFVEACDRFIEDMNSKPMSVSRRASVESFLAAQAAKAARKAERKAEKEQLKAEAAERKAEREERKEKEKLGLASPTSKSPKKKKSKKTAKEQEEQPLVAPPPPAALDDIKEEVTEKAVTNNNIKEEKPKKGGTWALPIVPKMPQKPGEKKKNSSSPSKAVKTKKAESASSTGGAGLANVWLQAFGAKPAVTKNIKQEIAPASAAAAATAVTTATAIDDKKDVKPSKKTYLDIPPEKRRRPKPNFGGLIHFSPDWERAVQKHHEKSRMPKPLVDAIRVKPHILNTSNAGAVVQQANTTAAPPLVSSTSSSADVPTKEDCNKYAALSSYLGSPTHSSDPGSPPPVVPSTTKMAPPTQVASSNEYPFLTFRGKSSSSEASSTVINTTYDEGIASVVEGILETRKRLRQSYLSRMYQVPFMKEKKKRVREEAPLEEMRLMSTPGLPEVANEDIDDDQIIKSFANFRRTTLLRYLDASENHSPELKAKLLDWKPEVLENKTRHQTTKAREVTAYKEIFGLELPGSSPPKTSKGSKKKQAKAAVSSPAAEETTTASETKPRKGGKKGGKKSAANNEAVVATTEVSDGSKTVASEEPEDEPPVSEEAEKLQTELQSYALDLLDSNASWERRTVIQNLVIWEPVTDPALLMLPPTVVVPGTVPGSAVPVNVQPVPGGRRRGKKVRKRQSGLDFSRKKPAASKGNSRDVSRAHSPSFSPDETKGVVHSLANILNDSKHMVMDKSAGETILHRAAKMGYPDVAAYALDMANMSATIKDNAGFPPIHKAALKGHTEIVDYLIRYGADPNTNVKGTRPLHEALEGCHIKTVVQLLRHGSDPLLYDYSGNMPIDLARESEDESLLEYFSAILGDLHGKKAPRWNVSHDRGFILPQSKELDLPMTESDDDDDALFEVSSQPLPPQFIVPQHPKDKYILATDLKRLYNVDASKASAKFTTFQMPREEFVKSAFCCLLGASVDPGSAEQVLLVKVDAHLRKVLGVDDAKLFHNLSMTSSKKKS